MADHEAGQRERTPAERAPQEKSKLMVLALLRLLSPTTSPLLHGPAAVELVELIALQVPGGRSFEQLARAAAPGPG